MDIVIRTQDITLGQFLKWAKVVATGGQAKKLIADKMVRVNGQVETRRGRTLRPGDLVSVDGTGSFRLVHGDNDDAGCH